MPPALLRLMLLLLGGAMAPLGAQAASLPIAWSPRWSNPLPHGNNVFAIAYSETLGRAVMATERGMIHYSDDLVDWIPRDTGTSVALRAATFFHGTRAVIVGEAGSVFYSDQLGGVSCLQPGTLEDGPTDDWLEGIAASPGLVVAVGDLGAIYTSPDGQSWRRQPTGYVDYLSGVAYGPGGFVAVGDAGVLLASPDGTNWTRRVVGSSDWLGITYGDGLYLAVGRAGAYAQSANGIAWTPGVTGHTNDLWVAAINDTSRLVAGSSEALISDQKGPWVDQLAVPGSPAPPGTYYAALGRPGYFLLSGRSGVIAEGYRIGGAAPYAWVENEPSLRPLLWEATWRNGLFVTVGQNGAVLTSDSGVDWALELVPNSVTNTTLLGVGGDTNLLLAVGTHGTILRSPNTLTNLTLTVTNGGIITTSTVPASTYGSLWLEVTPRPTTNQLQGVAAGGGLYVVTGANGEILTTQDGLAWNRRNPPTQNLLSGVTYSDPGFLACGQSGTLLASANGVAWRRVQSGVTTWLFRVRTRPGLACAVGESGTLLTSPDGTTWNSHTTGTAEFLTDVAWIGDLCLVCGQTGTILASTNYNTWTAMNPFTYRDLYGLCSDGTRCVLVGQEGVILRNLLTPVATPLELLDYSRTLDGSQTRYEGLFLFGGLTDQRFVLESAQDPVAGPWSQGPYLELLDGSGTLTYLWLTPTGSAPSRQYYRGRLLP